MALTKIETSNLADDAVDIAQLGATGTPSATTFLRGDNSWTAAGGGFAAYKRFDTSTSAGGYSPDTGVTHIIVEMVGGGGGSSGSTGSDSGSAGGGAAYALKQLTVTDTDTMTITIGAAGGSGGTTSFESVTGASFTTISCTGGGSGATNNESVAGGGG